MYKGLFMGTLKLIGRTNGEIEKVILKNAPKNNQLTSPKIQKDLVTCFGEVVLKNVIGEIGDDVFALLVDESSDVSRKEQIVVVLRFVDKVGVVQERFVGIIHVMDTSVVSLKSALDALFAKHGLSFTKVRGQGYDSASNMSGKFNGLKTLILSDNDSTFYIHCFAHQFQLVVVAVAKKHKGIKDFFDLIALVVNSYCKRKDMIRESHKKRIQEEIGNNEIETGKGLNQEISLVQAGDTRWNFHLKAIVSLIALFPEVIQVLEYVEDDGDNGASRLQARGLLSYLKTFEFVFYMHLISTILGLTNSLSQALQRKDEDILEAIDLIGTTKGQLQMLRENRFDQVFKKCYSFCDKYKIVKLDMAEAYVNTRNSRKRMNITNQHYYNYDIFNTILDMQIREFGDRFGEISTDLLQNMAALNPCNSFSQFNKSSLLKLSQMYPRNFDDKERIILEHELDIYYHSVYNDVIFVNLNGIADLARLMVATRKHLIHPLVYRLLKLTLVLPVATATVEICFSAMKFVKTDLRNQNGDDFLNYALICTIEKEALCNVKNKDVIDRFQKMKTRRGQI
ncbi:zinc finger MYM-type protein 1-like [Cynara cardunculus var. scolymus]|uniref:zinc finger MYM-type protein 1-like n=1 Tax=Cynara cardunculus var. scolymus TaxID=59895 RepID=UPI000D62ACBC|nr:zinc finger MYM-type protein 1-like [Cynara cardunculus var. scolymus]